MVLEITSDHKRQIIDITKGVERLLKGSGVANVFVKHTTAAVTLADLDPGTDQDFLDALTAMTPKVRWRHPHDPGHFPDHLWSALIGAGVSIPFTEGKLLLGNWQRLVLVELDGPRQRQLEITLLPAREEAP